MNNITSEGLSLLLSTGPLSYITDKKVPVNFSKRDLPHWTMSSSSISVVVLTVNGRLTDRSPLTAITINETNLSLLQFILIFLLS